jgi:uncharacterized protein YjbI with pentapeptide repeats
MHSRDRRKDAAAFRKEIDAILAGTSPDHRPTDRFDFSRFVFPEADFRGATFTQNASFSAATFTQNAYFSKATFTQAADFRGATFNQNADFSEARFTQNAYFRGATFTQDAGFFGATFTQNADFSEARFTQNAEFRRTTFTQDADFRGATFTQDADFRGATFTQAAVLRRATFTQVAYFFGATFTRDADFSGATFTQNADFRFATFTRNADFRGATFTQNANFVMATFTQVAYFFGATFTRDAHFSGAKFTRDAVFREATFTRDAHFIRATFAGNADFSEATFTRDAVFSQSAVAGVLDFRFLRIGRDGEVLLHRVNERREIEVPDSQGAGAQAVGSPEAEREIPTKKIPLSGLHARLLGTLLERIRFEDVRWDKEHGRLVLQDELDLADPTQGATHELVADAYRRLVNNFEKARQYELAEEAVVGEMEMRRLNPENFPFVPGAMAQGTWFWPRWRRWAGERERKVYAKSRRARWLAQHLSALYLYRLLSVYGSSYTRAFWVLVSLVLLFALLFPAAGLRMAGPSAYKPALAAASAASTKISWRGALAHPDRGAQLWGTFKSGLAAAFEVATFQRDHTVEPVSGPGRALATAEVIVVPAQVALLLLALRRRFRR